MSGVPYVFGNATTSIPLSQLDVNFATNATIGTTSVGLGNTTTTLVGLTNVSTTVVNTSNVSANTSLLLQTNGSTTAVTIDTNQNVGVGVTPSAWGGANNSKGLQVGRSGAVSYSSDDARVALSTNAFGSITNGWKFINNGGAAYYSISDYDNNHRWFVATTASGTAGSTISFTQAMTLDASGNLLINKTSRYSAEKISFNFSGSSQQGMVSNDTAASSGAVFSWFFSNGTPIGSITNNANTGVLYNVTSDQRLKENIQDAESASTLIDSLQVRQFDWRANGLHQRFGFVAQELVTVAPEAVYQPNDTEQMMAVDYSKLVPMLVKAIQEQQALITQLTARITALESA